MTDYYPPTSPSAEVSSVSQVDEAVEAVDLSRTAEQRAFLDVTG
ncbi:hypothetical protein [Nocardiopsis ansamitocini]|uniref:Uncharacterized protein n=1 Tax=Nocardiopsis ansamitocini TaxID=1670832 RepID=A0A9W6P225_9ACTN|nr:hypothetical protein [Nocardiopsis ansamitocini]GLU45810.1 hypothetical protein Nans01_01610 [Nocardiopsis ansamitocini]